MAFPRLVSLATVALTLLGWSCRDPLPRPEPDWLEVAPASRDLEPGDAVQLQATVGGERAMVAWESSDLAVATVSTGGLVQSHQSGFAAITATLASDPAVRRSANINVLALPGIQLSDGVPLSDLSHTGERGSGVIYRIFVPANATSLTIRTFGGVGDVDVYVRRGSVPTNTPSGSSHRSFTAGTEETITVANPASGTWYILLDLWEPYEGVTLVADYSL